MRWGDTPCDGEIRPVRCSACLLQQDGFPRPLAWAVGGVSSTRIGQAAPSRLGTVLDRGNIVRRQKDRTRRWLRSADEVVVVAQWLEEVLVRNGVPPGRVTVSRHGLSDDVRSMQEAAAAQRSPRDPDRPLRIGFVGRFTEVKGVHVLVDAVRRLPESVDVNVHLYGITQSDGDEQYLAGLKERARDEPRVRFCGPMTDDNRVEAFAGFDLLAVPSIGKETGPYTVLEAFAAEIPVLGSNHSGIRERVTDGESGRLVASGDPDAWAGALQDLYNRHRSGNWSWDPPTPRMSKDVAREMNALYRRVR
jgi:glycosyltransferase involved in cell wall biosynthesis